MTRARLQRLALSASRAVRRASARLARDERGNTLVEFALISPVFFTLLIGTANLGQLVYGKIVLNGAIEVAARASSLEGGDTTAADNMVRKIVGPILPGATYTITRSNYYDFADVSRAERFTDSNSDGVCDNNESYIDENNNGTWDADVAETGQGGASDVVVYQVRVQYRPLFRVPFMPNQWQQFTLNSKAVRKNQPFATQTPYSTVTRTCT
ncbi:MAG: pilus assembly protein [Sphingomonadales bacterium]|nr:pilus assembly protein [Sphingomonadales bacterium]